MKDYAMRSPTRNGKYFLPCHSITSPISGSETGPAGYDAAEGQARSTGNDDELESQIPQKHTQNPRSPVTKPRAMQMMTTIWVKWFSEDRWEKPSTQRDKVFFHLLLPVFLQNHKQSRQLFSFADVFTWHPWLLTEHGHFLYYYRIFSSRKIHVL